MQKYRSAMSSDTHTAHLATTSTLFDIIGYIDSPFVEKFGIPRQAGLIRSARSRIVLQPPFNRAEMVQGLEQFSHIWILFVFHDAIADGWKTTVRPPRLGGKKRIGVFASRSPHRPNHIGISAVRLENIIKENSGILIEISGADLLDGTPVVDIKPYLPYSDCIIEAADGFQETIKRLYPILFSAQAQIFCENYTRKTGRNLAQLITETLENDPRPASQKKDRKIFGISLWDVNIRWQIAADAVTVLSCELTTECQHR